MRRHQGGQHVRPPRLAREATDDEAWAARLGQPGGQRVEVAARVARVVGRRVPRALAQATDRRRAGRARDGVEVWLVADLEGVEAAAEAPLRRPGEREGV